MPYSKLLVICCLAGTIALIVPALPTTAGDKADRLTPKQLLGKMLYFDPDLSEPRGQSCASCHQPGAGFTDPDGTLPVSFGVIEERTGVRYSPSAAYTAYSPPLHYDEGESLGRRAVLGRPRDDAGRAGEGPVPEPPRDEQPRQGRRHPRRAHELLHDLFKMVYGSKSLNEVDRRTT